MAGFPEPVVVAVSGPPALRIPDPAERMAVDQPVGGTPVAVAWTTGKTAAVAAPAVVDDVLSASSMGATRDAASTATTPRLVCLSGATWVLILIGLPAITPIAGSHPPHRRAYRRRVGSWGHPH